MNRRGPEMEHLSRGLGGWISIWGAPEREPESDDALDDDEFSVPGQDDNFER